MMTQAQMDRRLEMIKEAAKRLEFKKRQQANAAKVAARSYTNSKMSKKEEAAYASDSYLAKLDENHNHYTDGSKYLAEHYGDRAAEQKSYESDWG